VVKGICVLGAGESVDGSRGTERQCAWKCEVWELVAVSHRCGYTASGAMSQWCIDLKSFDSH
jgi:hypothetical protein